MKPGLIIHILIRVGAKDFDRDGAIVAQILRTIYSGHATASEFAIDAVTIAQCCSQLLEYSVHRWGYGEAGPGLVSCLAEEDVVECCEQA